MELLNVDEAVGLVVGTVAATPLQFSVAISPEQYLQLDDVVVTQRSLPGQPPVQVSGVVTNVEAVHEGARFASDVFLIQQGALPAEIAEVAQVTVTRVEPEVYVPPMPGAVVSRATGKQRDSALYFDEMGEAKVPVGFGRDGQPVYINFEFVDGTRGAHVSISGVSGIATKTSFALFLLHSILNSGVLAGEAHNTKMLVFSVKGEDLLFLDYANQRLTPEQRKRYDELGLPATPFQNVRVFAPPRPGDTAGTPDVSARDKAVSPFYWTLAEFCEEELLPFVFADAEDERAQYTMLIGQVAARLRRDAVRTGGDGAVRISGVDPANDKIIRSFGDLVELLEAELGDDSAASSWVAGSAVTGSINALLRRLRSAVKPLNAIIRGDLAHRGERSISTSRAQVTVVDLHNLPDRAQRFVVGVTLRGEFARKERQGTARPLHVRRPRRAEQVRAARGRQPDQADPARRRRARPVARRHPHRRAADRVRGGTADPRQLRHPGRRAARRRRGRAARVRLPAARPARAGDDRQAGHHVHRPAGHPGAAGRRLPVPGLGDPAQRAGRLGWRRRRADRAGGPVRHHPRRPRRPAAVLRDAFPISAVPSVRNPGEFDIGPLASALTHWTEWNATRGCTRPRVTGGTRELSLKRSKCCDRVR